VASGRARRLYALAVLLPLPLLLLRPVLHSGRCAISPNQSSTHLHSYL
jgi:hypothetical protein